MAITQINIPTPSGLVLFSDTAMGGTIDAVKASSAKVYEVIIDNSANGAASYIKLYNAASGGVTVGTTVPDEVIFVPGSAIITYLGWTWKDIRNRTQRSMCDYWRNCRDDFPN